MGKQIEIEGYGPFTLEENDAPKNCYVSDALDKATAAGMADALKAKGYEVSDACNDDGERFVYVTYPRART